MQAANKPTSWLTAIAAYAIGAFVSSTALGAVLGFLGSILMPRPWMPVATLAIGGLGIALALSDLGVGGACTPTPRRQTQPLWWWTFGPTRAMFLWGVDLGLGFTTIRVASLYWIVVLVVGSLTTPPTGAAILGAYGLALVINLVAGAFLLRRCGVHANICALRLFFPLKISLAVVLLAWSILLLVIGLR